MISRQHIKMISKWFLKQVNVTLYVCKDLKKVIISSNKKRPCVDRLCILKLNHIQNYNAIEGIGAKSISCKNVQKI